MTTKVISFKSGQATVNADGSVLETGENGGISHVCNGHVNDNSQVIMTWKFDWEYLKSQGVDRLVGQLIVSCDNGSLQSHKVDIDWTETNQSVSAKLGSQGKSYSVSFEYNLTAHYAELSPSEKVSYDEMFAASDKTDVVLIVEGKKLNVNKAFLSFHSDYFSTLFSANFKEGQMKEIEIKEVSYEDFGLLLSTIYPVQVFPNDKTAEKLLELADRFLMPSVKHLVENHLLNHSKLENEKMMMLGDRYGIKSILDKSISRTNTVEKMKKLEKSTEYAKLSLETVARLFKRILQLV